MDKMEGEAKEAYGAIMDDEAIKAEGRAQQRKVQAEEAEQREKTRQARPRPTRQRRSETSKSSRTRAASWATWATGYPNSRKATPTPSQ
jgi:uncharacterized protein YjbJ (UPF0337 family)